MQLSFLTGTCLVNEGRCTLKHTMENLGLAVQMAFKLQFPELVQEIEPWRWLAQNEAFPANWTNQSIFLWRMLEHSYILKVTILICILQKFSQLHILVVTGDETNITYYYFHGRHRSTVSVSVSSFSEVLNLSFLWKEVSILHLNFWYFERYVNRPLGLRKKIIPIFIYMCLTTI